jgi:hypothetical protein
MQAAGSCQSGKGTVFPNEFETETNKLIAADTYC